MAEQEQTQPAAGTKDGDPGKLAALASQADAKKPDNVSNKEWRKFRMASGNMVVIRSHFKSIFLVPMALISLLCALVVAFSKDGSPAEPTMGLVWVCAFCLYMQIFIFEWTRAWTYALLVSVLALVCVGFAVDSPDFPVWGTLRDFLKGLNFQFSQETYLFFFIFFSVASGISWLKTRLNYVVFESNELQLYRNAWFGDRERISMLNPRTEVVIPDMLEYFHPFYRSGRIIIHAPDRSIVLDNVLNIRRIERATDRLGSALSVKVTE